MGGDSHNVFVCVYEKKEVETERKREGREKRSLSSTFVRVSNTKRGKERGGERSRITHIYKNSVSCYEYSYSKHTF